MRIVMPETIFILRVPLTLVPSLINGVNLEFWHRSHLQCSRLPTTTHDYPRLPQEQKSTTFGMSSAHSSPTTCHRTPSDSYLMLLRCPRCLKRDSHHENFDTPSEELPYKIKHIFPDQACCSIKSLEIDCPKYLEWRCWACDSGNRIYHVDWADCDSEDDKDCNLKRGSESIEYW